MKTLENKTVAITGAASGMGRALALHCARLGSKLAICDIDEAGVTDTAARALREGRGREVDAIKLDVSSREGIYAWAARVQDKLGGADVIVNNAGVSLSASIEKMRDEDFEWLFGINFWGVVNGCKAFLPQLRQKPEAHIVNLSSVFGIIGVPTQGAYCASKFAVRGYTETLRQELARSSIGVTCVHPGGIKTEIARRGRHYENVHGDTVDTHTVATDFERAARTTAEDAAAAIAGAILKNKRRLLIGADAVAIDVAARSLPTNYDTLVDKAMRAATRR